MDPSAGGAMDPSAGGAMDPSAGGAMDPSAGGAIEDRRRLRPALTAVAGGLLALLALGLAAALLVLPLTTSPEPSATTPGLGALGEDGGFTVWERNDDGTPVRWDPCTPIEVVWSPVTAPPGAATDLGETLDRLRDVSGLPLRLVGTTDERPSGSRLPYQPERYGDRWAPVLVAWADPAQPGLPLRDTDRGVAVPVAVGQAGDRTYVTGQVVLNGTRDDLLPGFDDRADAWGATLLHELLHVLGLGHVDDPTQLMHRYPGSGPVLLGDGDLAGVAEVGPGLGCRDVPPAGPVRVADPPSRSGHGVP